MTKYNSIKRKINKRTRKGGSVTSAPSLSSSTSDPSMPIWSDAPPCLAPGPSTSLQSNIPVSEYPKQRKITQTEKKSKYKLKKRQLNKNNPHNSKSTQKKKYFLTTTQRWLWRKHINRPISQLNIRNLYFKPITFQRSSNRTTLYFTT